MQEEGEHMMCEAVEGLTACGAAQAEREIGLETQMDRLTEKLLTRGPVTCCGECEPIKG
jgi:hypothetical protein